MQYFWAIFCSAVFVLIVWGIITSKIKQKRIRREAEALLPRIKDHISANRYYNVALNDGTLFKNIKFIGISDRHDESGGILPFPISEWLILEKEDGKRVYVKPQSIRYYEDAEKKS
jgi:hypothetical protein